MKKLLVLLALIPLVALFAEVTITDIAKWGLVRKHEIPAILAGTNSPASNPGYIRLYDFGSNVWLKISVTNKIIIIQQEITE